MKRLLIASCIISACGLYCQPADAQMVRGKYLQNNAIKAGQLAPVSMGQQIQGVYTEIYPGGDSSVFQSSLGTKAGAASTDADDPLLFDTTAKAYNNYDFVPGDTVLFEDHFTDDQDGEFPSHWDLKNGQAVLNKVNNELAFLLTDGNYCKVLPLIKSPSYLNDNFTVEYDIYANESYPLILYFYRQPNNFGDENFNVKVAPSECQYNTYDGFLKGDLPEDIREDNFKNKWHHIAIAYKKQQLKIYVDQYRVLVVPRTSFAPSHLDIESIGDQKNPIIFKNFRIAKGGGMNMLGKKFTNAKIVTHGINFDVDQATIKPESMGTLNMVLQVLKDNPELKFEIDGHTDNSGTPAHNLTLSQQRAAAVLAQLVTMGVDASRLTAKGFGDTKPISDNVTLEGKANNRRVEFVKH